MFNFEGLPPEVLLHLLNQHFSTKELLSLRLVSKTFAKNLDNSQIWQLACNRDFGLTLSNKYDAKQLKEIYKAFFYLYKSFQCPRADRHHYYTLHAGRLLKKYEHESWAKCGLGYLIGNGYGGFDKDVMQAMALVTEDDLTDNLVSQHYFNLLVEPVHRRDYRNIEVFENVLKKIVNLKQHQCITTDGARMIGSYYSDEKNFEEALFWYQKSYNLQPNVPKAEAIGDLYEILQKPEEAKNWYEQAKHMLNKDKNFLSSLHNLNEEDQSELSQKAMQAYCEEKKLFAKLGDGEAANDWYKLISICANTYKTKSEEAIRWLTKACELKNPQIRLHNVLVLLAYQSYLKSSNPIEVEQAKKLFIDAMESISPGIMIFITPDISLEVMEHFYNKFVYSKAPLSSIVTNNENFQFWFVNYFVGVCGVKQDKWKAFQMAEKFFEMGLTFTALNVLGVLSLDKEVRENLPLLDTIKWLQVACQCRVEPTLKCIYVSPDSEIPQDMKEKINLSMALINLTVSSIEPFKELESLIKVKEPKAAAHMALCFIYLTGVSNNGNTGIAADMIQAKVHFLLALKADWQQAFHYLLKMREGKFLQFETFIEVKQIFAEQKKQPVKGLDELKQWLNQYQLQDKALEVVLNVFNSQQQQFYDDDYTSHENLSANSPRIF